MQRLKTRPQFQAAMAAGTVSRTAHFALHRMVLAEQVAAVPPAGPGSQDPQALFGVGAVRQEAWLGAMVPKRWARRSVTRHAIKRQIYAVGDEHEALLRQGAHVVRLRSGFDRRQFVSATSDALKQAVRAELQQLFAYAAKRLARERSDEKTAGGEAAAGATLQAAP
ncbi:ribonuclease P protein component [Delftia sp. PS-11]|uniref:ribonuclease P protein component n=1 Tax=Delftia sp. PS-11 TaxID=2767222 RepID=UPI0024565607|nr:ribonuclease P protein component [Delftia sp. PS-11]KAJ8743251.1 ribonuclease P protein component [Delftia sp. PS-11]